MLTKIRSHSFAALLVLGAAVLSSTPAFAQECVPDSVEICVFDLPDYGGGWNKMTRGASSNPVGTILGTYYHPASFPAGVADNWIGSIIVGSNARARICKDPYWRGSCFDLTPGGWNLGSFNNAISSVRVDWGDQSCWQGSNWPIFPHEVSIHEHSNQTGDCTTKDHFGFDYPHAGFMGLRNDTMSSVRVGPNTQAVICRNNNQGTPCSVFFNASGDPSNFNLSGTPVGNEKASSIEIGDAPF